MNYTPAQADAFERILELLRKSAGYKLRLELPRLQADRYVQAAGLKIFSVADLVAVTTCQEFQVWLRDYENLAVHAQLGEALDHLPAELAKLIAKEQRMDARSIREGGGRTAREVVAAYLAGVAERIGDGEGQRLWSDPEEPGEFEPVDPNVSVVHPAETVSDVGPPSDVPDITGPGNPETVPAAAARRDFSPNNKRGA